MNGSFDSKRTLDARTKDLEEMRSNKSRLEHELLVLRTTLEQEKLRHTSENGMHSIFLILHELKGSIEQKEFDCQQLRDQLALVTSQLEREREQYRKQMDEKIQELVSSLLAKNN